MRAGLCKLDASQGTGTGIFSGIARLQGTMVVHHLEKKIALSVLALFNASCCVQALGYQKKH
jgi:hypothetical protein